MIHELEDAMLKRIRDAQAAGVWPYKILTIDNYAGQIDEGQQSTFKFPAVFCSFVKWRRKASLGERTRLIVVDMMVYICARNPRNSRAARQGDAGEVGSYQMAEDLVALLENQRLGMPMHQPLMATGVETVYIGRKADGANAESILAIPMECEFTWQAALPDCAQVSLDDWLRTGQTYYLPGDDDADLAALINHA
jgi:phage gp37-like protein